MITFAPATRKSTRARIALCGPSGSGKTYTGLSLACALGDKVAVIDTERGSASKYVGENGWQFDTVAPGSFAPDALTGLLAEAGSEGYEVVLLDSWSHYWMGVDGMLEQVDRRARNGNSFSGWKEVRPDERRMIDALISYPGHVIATLRVKTEYVIEENDRGKKVPRKVGLKPEQRDGIEYEFDLVGDLDHDNTLTVSKSRIPSLSRAVIPTPGVDLAKQVAEWLTDGVSVPDARELRQRAIDAAVPADVVALAAEANKLGISNAAVPGLDGLPTSLVNLMRARHAQLEAKPGEVAP